MHKKRVFSGVQPTGNLHLGNYLGAIKNFVDLQNKFECIYCIVDLHAITNRQDPKELKSNVMETMATFIASGLNPEKNIIFFSGFNPEAIKLATVSRTLDFSSFGS